VIADDEQDTVSTLCAILQDEGYLAVGVLRGADVLSMVHSHTPHAVVLDIDMPGMSGYAVAQAIRLEYRERAPLLVAVSGKWVQQTDKLLAITIGFDHFLAKPCEPRQLLKLLNPLRSSA
jgi:DNA-binding response OmpR family regulator